MKYTSEVNIKRKDFDRINSLLQEIDFDNEDKPIMKSKINELDAKKDTMVYGFGFEFDDGSIITIDICSGQHNYYDDCVWVSADSKSANLFDCGYFIDDEMEFRPTNSEDVYICKFVIEEDLK